MWPVMHDLGFRGLHADALFASGVQRCDEPDAAKVRQAIAVAIRAFGCSGCTGRVAQEFGDHPETAVIRMRWAHSAAGAAFAESAPQPDPGADASGWHAVRSRLSADRVAGSPGIRPRDPAVFLTGEAVT
jgi:hypothetical protein